jgi:hypothetical protein
MLTFPDGYQIGVTGLDEIFEDVHRERKAPDTETVTEIVDRLSVKNYIAPTARKRYEDLLLKEYHKFCQSKITEEDKAAKKETSKSEKK